MVDAILLISLRPLHTISHIVSPCTVTGEIGAEDEIEPVKWWLGTPVVHEEIHW